MSDLGLDLTQLEQATVRSGWQLVDLLNGVGSEAAAKAGRHQWDADWERAVATVEPLDESIVGPRHAKSYESRNNMTRFARTLDFVRPGDRVFDIGLGGGYLPGILIRDGQLDRYHGVDIVSGNVNATEKVIAGLGAGDRASVEISDLYELTREQLTALGTTLLICCEVIEHVPDPERALTVLADSLPNGAELLFSVPLLKRLEGIWGHVAFFDTNRVQTMLENAGLTAHVVEPVANAWVFVLASRSTGVSMRGLAAVTATAGHAFAPPPAGLPTRTAVIDLRSVAAEPGRHVSRVTENTVEADDRGISCRMISKEEGPATGGMRIPVESPMGFRFEIEPQPLDAFRAVRIDAYADDELVARWRWEPAKSPPKSSRLTTVLRPGKTGSRFVPQRVGKLTKANWVEIVGELEPQASAELTVTRATVLK